MAAMRKPRGTKQMQAIDNPFSLCFLAKAAMASTRLANNKSLPRMPERKTKPKPARIAAETASPFFLLGGDGGGRGLVWLGADDGGTGIVWSVHWPPSHQRRSPGISGCGYQPAGVFISP